MESSNQFRLNCSKDDFIKKSNYFLHHILGEKRGLKRVCAEEFGDESTKISKTDFGAESTKISKTYQTSERASKLSDKPSNKMIQHNISNATDHSKKTVKSQTKLYEILSNKKGQNGWSEKSRNMKFESKNMNDQTKDMSMSSTFRKMVRKQEEPSQISMNSMKEFIKSAQDSVTAESQSSTPSITSTDKNNNNIEEENNNIKNNFEESGNSQISSTERVNKTEHVYGLRPRSLTGRRFSDDSIDDDDEDISTLEERPNLIEDLTCNSVVEVKSMMDHKPSTSPGTSSTCAIVDVQKLSTKSDTKLNVSSRASHKKSLSKYKRITANARERDRMKEINVAFAALRSALPDNRFSKNMSSMTKHNTLQLALSYIAGLQRLLQEDPLHQPTSFSKFLKDNSNCAGLSEDGTSFSKFLQDNSNSNSNQPREDGDNNFCVETFSKFLEDNSNCDASCEDGKSFSRLLDENSNSCVTLSEDGNTQNFDDFLKHYSETQEIPEVNSFNLSVDVNKISNADIIPDFKIDNTIQILPNSLENVDDFNKYFGLDVMFDQDNNF